MNWFEDVRSKEGLVLYVEESEIQNMEVKKKIWKLKHGKSSVEREGVRER